MKSNFIIFHITKFLSLFVKHICTLSSLGQVDWDKVFFSLTQNTTHTHTCTKSTHTNTHTYTRKCMWEKKEKLPDLILTKLGLTGLLLPASTLLPVNHQQSRSLSLSVYLSLSVCVAVSLSVCLFVYVAVCLSIK